MNDTWTPRRCTPEYFESRQQEMSKLDRRTYPWQEQQGRNPWLKWNEIEKTSEPVEPMTWKDEALKYGIAALVVAWTGFLGWVLFQVATGITQ